MASMCATAASPSPSPSPSLSAAAGGASPPAPSPPPCQPPGARTHTPDEFRVVGVGRARCTPGGGQHVRFCSSLAWQAEVAHTIVARGVIFLRGYTGEHPTRRGTEEGAEAPRAQAGRRLPNV
jgi:hypothetical protein